MKIYAQSIALYLCWHGQLEIYRTFGTFEILKNIENITNEKNVKWGGTNEIKWETRASKTVSGFNEGQLIWYATYWDMSLS